MSNRISRKSRTLLLFASLAALVSCAGTGTSKPEGASDPERTDPTKVDDAIAARIDGRVIRLDDVDQWLKDDWFVGVAEEPEQLYQLRRAGVDGVIDEQLIESAAASEGLSAAAYIESQAASLGPVTDREIDSFYARNKDRIRPAQPIEQLRPKIRAFLEGDRNVRVINALREESKIEILMVPPPPPPIVRIEIPSGGSTRGPADAPVTIVEFSDYQCPYCRRAEDTLAQLDALYPGQLRIEYRHLPLDFHADALPAAKAAVCADDQERFWDFHALLFANQRSLGADQLLDYATQLDLDVARFKTCQSAPETQARVDADIALAKEVGASATPTFFVNGITLRGAQPAEAFRSIIDRELENRASSP